MLVGDRPYARVMVKPGRGADGSLAAQQETTTLYRPVGRAERTLIAGSGWRRFPPRLDHQPIFYPVLNEEYAMVIARDWNTRDEASGHAGYVLRSVFGRSSSAPTTSTPSAAGCVRSTGSPPVTSTGFDDAIIDRIEQIAAHLGPGGE